MHFVNLKNLSVKFSGRTACRNAAIHRSVLALLLISMHQAAHAQDKTWTGASDTNWSDDGNWLGPPNTAPGILDTAIINDGTLANQPEVTTFEFVNRVDISSSGIVSLGTGGNLNSTNGFDISNSGRLQLLTAASGLTGDIRLSDGGELAAISTLPALSFSIVNDIDVTAPATAASIIAGDTGAGDVLTLGGALTLNGNSTLDLVSSGGSNDGTIVLNNTTIDASANSAINVGTTVQIGNGGLTIDGTANITATGILDINGNPVTVDNLDGVVGAQITNNSGVDQVLTVNNATGNQFDGTISDGVGTVGLTKQGNGTLTLTGNNSFSGGTVLSAGVLVLGSDTAAGVGVIDLTGGGLTFSNGVTAANDVTLSANAGMSVVGGESATQTGDISGTGQLTKQGNGTLTLAGDSTFSGGTALTAGTLVLGSDTGAGTGSIDSNGGNLTFSDGVSAANDMVLSMNTNMRVAGGESATQTGNISGAGQLKKQGNGTLALAGNSTYSGGTNVLAGTLSLNSDDAAGTGMIDLNGGDLAYGNGVAVANTVRLSVNSLLTVDAGDSATQSARVRGPGRLTKQGDGTLTLTAANTYDGDTRVNAGVLGLDSDKAAGNGTIDLNGGDLAYGDGVDIGNSVTLSDDATLSVTGSATQSGVIDDGVGTFGLTKQGDGTLTLTAANTYDGDTTVAGGTLNSTTAIGDVNIDGGATFNLQGGTAGDITNDGTLDIAATTMTGGVTNDGTATNAGTVNGTVTNEGTLTSTNEINGDLVNRAAGDATIRGTLNGALENRDTATLTIDGNLTGVNSISQTGDLMQITAGKTTVDAGGAVSSSGQVDLSATLTGRTEYQNQSGGALNIRPTGVLRMDLANRAGADLDNDGTVKGSVSNAGTALLAGTIIGKFSNTGTATVDGAASITGKITNDNVFNVNAALTNAREFKNNSTLNIGGMGATGTGRLTNANGATLNLMDGSQIGGALDNSGTVNLTGATTIAGLLTNSGTGVIDMQNGLTTDRMNVSGGALLDGNVNLDIDLSGVTNQSDTIDVSGGALDGNVTLNFSNSGMGHAILGSDISVLSFDPGQANTFGMPASTGLPTSGAVLYSVLETAPGQLSVRSGANPLIGGIANGVTLTQSLIGSVINRPSSPFVAGLAAADENPCGPGLWARATGGQADATGTVTTDLGPFEGSMDLNYGGIQVGSDFSCFDGHFNGWDLSFGGIAGYNGGSTRQEVFDFDPFTGQLNRSTVTGLNETDFQQTYGGIYIAGARDRLIFEVQYRFENTEFDISNVTFANLANRLGVSDQKFDSRAHTLSGSLGYVFSLNEDQGVSFIPTVGFALSRTKVDPIRFDNVRAVPGDDGVLVIDDTDTQIGFVSGTLAKTQILPGGTAALNYFATGTVYHDFAEDQISNYFSSVNGQGQPAGPAERILASNLGTYGEASFGANYTKLLEPGRSGPARQFNASMRLDTRYGSELESWGVTAQMRLQF